MHISNLLPFHITTHVFFLQRTLNDSTRGRAYDKTSAAVRNTPAPEMAFPRQLLQLQSYANGNNDDHHHVWLTSVQSLRTKLSIFQQMPDLAVHPLTNTAYPTRLNIVQAKGNHTASTLAMAAKSKNGPSHLPAAVSDKLEMTPPPSCAIADNLAKL